MLANQLKLAWRNLNKNKIFSVINIGGLSIGIAGCLLIVQYVSFELSYNSFHEKKEDIYRISYSKVRDGEESFNTVLTYSGVGPTLKEQYPIVKEFVRLRPASLITSNAVITVDENVYDENRVYFSEPSLFIIFSFDLITGDPVTALKEQFTTVISERTAKKYFGNDNPVGKTFKRGMTEEYTITGVFKDIPPNSHVKFDILLSHSTLSAIMREGWTEDNMTNFHGHLYVLLQPGSNPDELRNKFPQFVDDFIWPIQVRQENTDILLGLMPIGDIHLHSAIQHEAEINGNYNVVKYLSIIATLLLLIAWVNYVNLSTAKSTERAKEVGIRKVLGSQRNQLFGQFLVESIVVNAMAIVFACLIVFLSQNIFERFGITEMVEVKPWSSSLFWIALFPLFIFGVLFSGGYPAIVLSRFIPVEVLKGKFISSSRGIVLRKGLVVFQFTAAICLLIGTLIVYHQIEFMRSQDLGINIERSLVIKAPTNVDSTYLGQITSFKNRIQQNATIRQVIASQDIPGREFNSGTWFKKISDEDGDAQFCSTTIIDEYFIPGMEVSLLAGRNFTIEDNENSSIIINERAMQGFKFENPVAALGRELTYLGNDGSLKLNIVGVVKDYHQLSPKLEHVAEIIRYSPVVRNYFIVKLNAGSDPNKNIRSAITFAESIFNETFPGNPFNYFFLDDEFEKQYAADKTFGDLFGIFSLLAVFVACLGLFGLSSYMVIQKSKEIGVRKVLGASVQSILLTLSWEYMKLLIFATVIGWPIIYFLMNSWLATFASHIQVNAWLFLISSVSVTIITLLTIGFHTTKAALVNPVKSLRYE